MHSIILLYLKKAKKVKAGSLALDRSPPHSTPLRLRQTARLRSLTLALLFPVAALRMEWVSSDS